MIATLPGDYPNRIRRLRARLDLTQTALAERLGVSFVSVNRWENGHARPAVAMWRRLAELDPAGLGTRAADSSIDGARPAAPLADRRAAPEHAGLPVPVNSFVGRQRELARLAALLSTARLITIVGPAGCGKTRLALEAVRSLLPCSAGGLRFVALDAVGDPRAVPGAVAAACGAHERSGRPLLETLCRQVGDRDCLLILDNCEHVLGSVASLTEALLGACPHLHLLLTSREVLHGAGETVLPLAPLALPEPASGRSPAVRVQAAEAVALLLDRARAAVPAFELTDGNAAPVATICRLLDGLPLAIELVAPWLRLLPPEQIAARLDERFRLLSGHDSTPARHQTLQAAIAWSYDLLDDAGRALFARLGVFAGGFTAEAAEAVCADEDALPRVAVLPYLSSLADKSLLNMTYHRGTPRLRLLESPRLYARERLQERGETDAVAGRHAARFLLLAEEADRRFEGAERARWMAELALEHDNLRAALRYYAGHHDGEALLRLAAALWRFWYIEGHLSEGREWLERALAGSEPQPPRLRLWALTGAAMLSAMPGDAAGRELRRACLEAARQVDDPAMVALSLGYLGAIAASLGERDAARSLLEESLRLARRTDYGYSLASTLIYLGDLALDRGAHDEARAYTDDGLAHMRRLGDAVGIAGTLPRLGRIAFLRGDYAGARAVFAEAVTVIAELQAATYAVNCLDGLADTLAMLDEPLAAARLWGAAEAISYAIGSGQPPRWAEQRRACIALARARLGESSFTAAWAEGEAMGLAEALNCAALCARDGTSDVVEPVSVKTVPAATPTTLTLDARGRALSERESEVLRLLAEGAGNKEIADRLVLSVRTVERHIANVYGKTGIHGRGALIAFARDTTHPHA